MLRMNNNYMPAQGSQPMGGGPMTPMTPRTNWAAEINGGPSAPSVISYDDPAAVQEAGTASGGAMQGGAPGSSGGMMSTRMPGGINNLPTGQLEMKNHLSQQVIGAPDSVEETYMGSWKALLARNVGSYVVATFLIGTQGTVSWEGILYDVGNNYLTIYQEARNRYIVSDYYALKFVEFYDTRRQAMCNELLREQDYGSTTDMG